MLWPLEVEHEHDSVHVVDPLAPGAGEDRTEAAVVGTVADDEVTGAFQERLVELLLAASDVDEDHAERCFLHEPESACPRPRGRCRRSPRAGYRPAMGVEELLGDPAGLYRLQRDRCATLGIDVVGLPVGHLAYRTRTWREYVGLRDRLEVHCTGNLENVWNGRPISKILLRTPIVLDDGAVVELIELIPPFHQRVYRMGLEHLGYVVGDDFDDFSIRHRPVLTGQQFQSPISEPLYILFDDYSHVKFHRHSLGDVCRMEGQSFDRIVHADWHPADDLAGPYEVA